MTHHSTRLPLSVPAPPPPVPSEQTPNATVSSTPMWDANHTPPDTPAWNPSSRMPLPIRSSTPLSSLRPAPSVGVTQPGCDHPLFKRPPCQCYIFSPYIDLCPDSSGVPVDWLAMECLHGKSVLVRLLSPVQHEQKGRRKKTMILYEGTLGNTLGTPVTGDPPVIEVKPCIPGVKPISIPLDNLMPQGPHRVDDSEGPLRAFVIAGDSELLGQEVIVSYNDGKMCHVYVPNAHPNRVRNAELASECSHIPTSCLVVCNPS